MQRYFLVLTLFMGLMVGAAHADDGVEQKLTLKDHAFTPREMTVPAGTTIKITLTNQDASGAEFESYELNREKVVAAGGTISFFVGPLDPGTYPYFDDFHRDTTTGTIVAK